MGGGARQVAMRSRQDGLLQGSVVAPPVMVGWDGSESGGAALMILQTSWQGQRPGRLVEIVAAAPNGVFVSTIVVVWQLAPYRLFLFKIFDGGKLTALDWEERNWRRKHEMNNRINMQ